MSNQLFLNQITIVIKTFERVSSLKRLLKSIYEKYPDIKIIISDDSKNASKNKIYFEKKYSDKNIKYLDLNFDVGLSTGRNKALENVKTKFFVLCDDDFVFTEKTDLEHMVEFLINKKLDILGGAIYEAKHFIWPINIFQGWLYGLLYDLSIKNNTERVYFFTKKIEFIDQKTIKIINLEKKDFFYRCDIVPNFFIGKVNSIKKIGGWSDNLKLLEHGEFFLRAKRKGLKVAFTKKSGIYHIKGGHLNYYFYRYRIFKYQLLSFKEMKIEKRILPNGVVQYLKNGKIKEIKS